MAAFGITAICPSTSTADVHHLGYETERTSGDLFEVTADDGTDDAKQRFRVTALGDIMPAAAGVGAKTNADTTGFQFIRSMDGAPTGVPANAATGFVPMVYDYTNDALYIYNGGWVSVSLS